MIPAKFDLLAWDAPAMRLYPVEAVVCGEDGVYQLVQCYGKMFPLHNFTYFYLHYN